MLKNRIKNLDNQKAWPKEYVCTVLEPGLVSYEDVGCGVALLRKDAIVAMLPSFIGKPVIPKVHKDVTPEDFEKHAVGYVTKAWWDIDTNWAYFAFILIDDDSKEDVEKNGYSVSCAYDVIETGPGGEWHAIKYDEEILQGSGTHLALVTSPRYEDCRILVNCKNAKMVEGEGKAPSLPKLQVFTKENETEKKRKVAEVGGNWVVLEWAGSFWQQKGKGYFRKGDAENYLKQLESKDEKTNAGVSWAEVEKAKKRLVDVKEDETSSDSDIREAKMEYEEMLSVYREGLNKSNDSPEEKQKRIAIDTVKNPNKALLGGPSVEESKTILKKKFGYTDEAIKKLENASLPILSLNNVDVVFQNIENSDGSFAFEIGEYVKFRMRSWQLSKTGEIVGRTREGGSSSYTVKAKDGLTYTLKVLDGVPQNFETIVRNNQIEEEEKMVKLYTKANNKAGAEIDPENPIKQKWNAGNLFVNVGKKMVSLLDLAKSAKQNAFQELQEVDDMVEIDGKKYNVKDLIAAYNKKNEEEKENEDEENKENECEDNLGDKGEDTKIKNSEDEEKENEEEEQKDNEDEEEELEETIERGNKGKKNSVKKSAKYFARLNEARENGQAGSAVIIDTMSSRLNRGASKYGSQIN